MRHSLRGKILLAIMVVTAIAAIATTSVYYLQTSATIEENYREALHSQMKQTGLNLDDSMKRIYQLTVQIACNDAVLNGIVQYQEAETEENQSRLTSLLQDYVKRRGCRTK